MFRLLEDRALINRLGFNSPGMVSVARNLQGWRMRDRGWGIGTHVPSPIPHAPVVGVNIGKNRATPLERAAEDYVAAFIALAPLADYMTINISSPNTPGLRLLHERVALETLLGELAMLNRRLARPRPLFLKVSPDESPAQLEEVVRVGCAAGIAGIVATNTTLAREGLRSPLAAEAGGLSGRPLKLRARDAVARIYSLTGGRLPIVGAGGVASGADAYARMRAGASLVQLYTGMIYEGPGLAAAIKRDLARRLRRDGYRSSLEAVGADHGT
jgi:dihydroorotate dehydrogenase